MSSTSFLRKSTANYMPTVSTAVPTSTNSSGNLIAAGYSSYP